MQAPNASPYGAPATGNAPIGTVRNPLVLFVISMVTCGIGAFYLFHVLRQTERDLRAFLGEPNPSGSIIWYFFPLLPTLAMPDLMQKARAKANTKTQGPGNLILYIFLGWYFILQDSNEIWQARSLPS